LFGFAAVMANRSEASIRSYTNSTSNRCQEFSRCLETPASCDEVVDEYDDRNDDENVDQAAAYMEGETQEP
jgi:hypothetical protein